MGSADSSLHRWKRAADTFNELGWFLPAYITGKTIFELSDKIGAAPPRARPDVLADGVCELYAPRALAVMLLYRYRTWPFVREFGPTISECIEASCYGFLRVATTGLAPVVEGIARTVARDQHLVESAGAANLFRDVVKHLGSRAEAAGVPADEGALLVRSFRRFFDERFWGQSSKRPAGESLNRHVLLHGLTVGENYGTRYNFSRLISVLDLLCFLITFIAPPGERLSILAPDETDESRALSTYFGFAAIGRLGALSQIPVDPGAKETAERAD